MNDTVTVTKLARNPDHGEWECNVTVDGKTYHATRQHGSWAILIRRKRGGRKFRRAHPPGWVAAELQRRVRRLEYRERRAGDDDSDGVAAERGQRPLFNNEGYEIHDA